MTPVTDLSQLDFSKTYTYADYLSWKFDEFVELIKGKVFRPMAGPSRRHQEYSRNLLREISVFLKGRRCHVYHAPFDVRLTTASGNGDRQIQTVVQPDLCVVCDPVKLDDRGCVGAPDWIIEIISPGTAAYDTKTKFDLYEESGVREYWVVYPGERSVAVFELENDRYRLVGEFYEPGAVPVSTLPGLTLEWADIFETA